MEEEKRTFSLYYQILCLSPECEQWWTASRKKHGSWKGARKGSGSRCSLRIWCLALLFNRYRDNVPEFPGTRRTLPPYLFSCELWLVRPLFLPSQVTPQVLRPRPPPALRPIPASRKINPTISVITCVQVPRCYCVGFFHLFSFQWHPWLAQSCPSHDWTFAPPSCACLGLLLWSPLHSAWMKNK